ncbi:hypothetical protein NUH88_11275 [Nisaea acidiphila]|uniref:DUF805 domain-containing protein n=1 Tax=Nisaea acidiphila TaxID=1862145 RepID=A0A9J7ALF2_9PROT|nr:hypothetical protein [Nisaea acidiphila]UUX47999.1 hypothetical protein NUH88_11275 [Nisaea acidiphila]
MQSEKLAYLFEELTRASQVLLDDLGTFVLIMAAWFAIHSIFVYSIRTKRTLDRQSFLTRAFTASIIGFAFSEIVSSSLFGEEIQPNSLWMFLSLFMAWQIYLIYLGIQRTNRIGISKWWNLLISIPATNNILYLLVIFFWRDRKPAH